LEHDFASAFWSSVEKLRASGFDDEAISKRMRKRFDREMEKLGAS
jgi:hypothetical protein